MKFRLQDAEMTVKVFLTAFIFVLTVGYAVGLLFVEHTTAMSPAGVGSEFAGSEGMSAAGEMHFAKSPYEMFVFIHNHVISLSVVFFCLGSIFFFSSLVSDRLKRFLMIEPLIAIVTTFGGIALVRFVAGEFVWVVLISGVSLGLCYLLVIAIILYELWIPVKTK